MIMGSGVIIISPHEFKELSCWYYREYKAENYEFAFVPYGTPTIPNFTTFFSPLSTFEMRTEGHHIEEVKKGFVRLSQVRDAHAQNIMGSGIFIIPPHE
jgi:hypothetical protein